MDAAIEVVADGAGRSAKRLGLSHAASVRVSFAREFAAELRLSNGLSSETEAIWIAIRPTDDEKETCDETIDHCCDLHRSR